MRFSGLSIRKPAHQIKLSTTTAKARLARGPAAMIAMRRHGEAAKNDPGSSGYSALSLRHASRRASSPFILQNPPSGNHEI